MTKVAIYARVSTDEQRQRKTIDQQLEACRERAKVNGWTVVGEFPDDAVSGTVPFDEREQGKALLAALEAREADTVLINYADRLARDQIEGGLAYRQLRKLAAVEFVSQSFDDTPEGIFTLQVFLAVAELDRRNIIRRTAKGRQARARRGEWYTPFAPFGFSYVAGTGKLSVNEAEAAVVRRAFSLYRSGLSIRAVAHQPDAECLTTKRTSKGWAPEVVRRMLTNRVYQGEAALDKQEKGKARPREEWTTVPVPKLVDDETWRAVQSRMSRNNRWRQRPMDGKSPYLLGGLAYCQTCGLPLRAATIRENHTRLRPGQERKQWRYFRCPNGEKYGQQHLTAVALPAAQLEGPVVEAVLTAFSDPALVLEAVRAYADTIEGDVEDAVLADLRRNIAAAETERERVLDMYQSGDIDKAQKDRRLARVDGRLREWGETLGAMEAAAQVRDRRAEIEAQAFQITANIRQVFEGEPFERQREWMRTLVDKVWVDKAGRVTIEATVPEVLPHVGACDYRHRDDDHGPEE